MREVLPVKLQLANLESAVVVYDTQRVIIRAHLEPINIREYALCAQAEATLALFIALVSADRQIVEHLLEIESRLVVGELYLPLVEELDHDFDVGIVIIAPERVLQQLSYDRLSRVVLKDIVYVCRASSGELVVEVILKRRAVKLSVFQLLLDIGNDRSRALFITGGVAFKKITKQLFNCIIAFAHYPLSPFLRAIFSNHPRGRLM